MKFQGPVIHPCDDDLSLGTPVSTPAAKTCRWGPRYGARADLRG